MRTLLYVFLVINKLLRDANKPCDLNINYRVGLEVPKVEVKFENLNISTKVHVGSRALPSLTNYVNDITEVKVPPLYI